MKTKVKVNRVDVDSGAFCKACTKAERILAQQIHKDTEVYVPMLTGTFSRNSRVLGSIIEYVGDQTGYLWAGVKMVNAKTGKGPRVIPGVGPRWPKHAVLAPTSEPLNYTKDFHPKAGPAWMDRSEADNHRRWKTVAEEAVANGYNDY